MTRPLTTSLQGNAVLSTTQSKFDGYSIALDGTDYLNIDSAVELAFGTNDFCIESWVYKASGTSYHTIFDTRNNGSDGGGIVLGINNSNQIYMYYNFGYRITTPETLSNGQWYHIALARVSGTTRVFINGTASSATYADTNNYAQRWLHVGADPTGAWGLIGYVDEIRVSLGNGRYSSNFTAPTARFNNDSYTSLLVHANLQYGILDDVYNQTDNDDLYIVDSYFDGDGYFVYTASAQSSISSSASIACTISHIEGADLVAFNTASLTADANILKDVAATLTAQATIDQFIGNLYVYRSASLSVTATQTTSADRTRDESATLASEFTFLGLPDIITPTGEIKEFAASITGTFAQSQTVELYKDMASDLYVDAVCDPDGVQRTRGFESTQSAEFTQTTINYRIVQGDCAFDALFAPSMTVEAVRNAFAVLDSTAALTTVVTANRSAQVALSSIINQSLQGDRFRDYAATLQSTATTSVDATNVRPFDATLSSQASLTADNNKILSTTATLGGAFSPTLTVDVFRNEVANLSSTFAQTTIAKKTVGASASLSGLFAEVTAVTSLPAKQFFVSALDITTYNSVHPKLYNGSTDSTVDQYGNVYSVGTEYYGYNSSGVYYNVNALLTKHNARGELLWQRKLTSFNADLGDSVVRIVEENDIAYITVSGMYKNASSAYVFTSYVYKLNLTSDVLQYLPTPQGIIIDAQIYNDNLYTVSDYIGGPVGAETSEKLVVTKWNTNGTINWSSSYNPTGNSYIGATSYRDYSFDVNANGVFLGAGTGIYPSWDGCLYRYPLTGGTPTITSIAIAGNCVKADSSGNIYVAGISGAPSTRTFAKYNSSYVKQWSRSGSGIPTEFVINSNDDIIGFGTTITLLENDFSSIVTGSLYTSDSSNVLYTNIVADRVRVKNGWLNVAGRWTRSSSETEYAVWQVDETLSKPSFQVMVWSAYRDTNNTYLNWNISSGTPSYSSYGTTTTSATASNIGATTSGSVSTAGYYEIAYTEIPLFVGTFVDATISSQFAISTTGQRYRSTSVQLSSTFTATTNAIIQASGSATSTAQATIVTNGGYIFGATANLSSPATVSATALRTKQLDATLSTQAVLTTNTIKYPGGGANLVAETTLTEQTTRIVQFNATLEVAGSELTAINKIGQGLIGLDVAATQATTAVKTTTTSLDEHIELVQVTEAFKTVRTSLDVEARVTASIQADRIKSPDATLTTTFTQTTTTSDSKIGSLTASESTTVTLSATAIKIVQFAANINSNFAQATTALATKPTTASLSVTVTETATAVKTVDPQLTFQAIATEMVIGSAISFDKELQLVIPAEYRTILIPEELTLLVVPEETRVNMVRKIAL